MHQIVYIYIYIYTEDSFLIRGGTTFSDLAADSSFLIRGEGLGPFVPGTHVGPGPIWAQGPFGPGPIWAQAHLGPGPSGPWARAQMPFTLSVPYAFHSQCPNVP